MLVQDLAGSGPPLQDADLSLPPLNFSFSLELQLRSCPVGCYRVGIASPAPSFCHQAVVTFAPRESRPPAAHISVLSRKHLSLLLSVQVHPLKSPSSIWALNKS